MCRRDLPTGVAVCPHCQRDLNVGPWTIGFVLLWLVLAASAALVVPADRPTGQLAGARRSHPSRARRPAVDHRHADRCRDRTTWIHHHRRRRDTWCSTRPLRPRCPQELQAVRALVSDNPAQQKRLGRGRSHRAAAARDHRAQPRRAQASRTASSAARDDRRVGPRASSRWMRSAHTWPTCGAWKKSLLEGREDAGSAALSDCARLEPHLHRRRRRHGRPRVHARPPGAPRAAALRLRRRERARALPHHARQHRRCGDRHEHQRHGHVHESRSPRELTGWNQRGDRAARSTTSSGSSTSTRAIPSRVPVAQGAEGRRDRRAGEPYAARSPRWVRSADRRQRRADSRPQRRDDWRRAGLP